jgi:glycolate oxidase FAD binding subunit
VVVRGNGTKLGWGAPVEGVDLVVDTHRLDRIIEHAPGDLLVRTQAGVALSTVQDRCAGSGQMLALEPIVAGGTVGGTIATDASGPRRLRYGTCRDLLVGITVVLADGTVAHAGGKVVKNVAGYDLGKLYIGSFGTLGVVTEAVFRLHPRPAAVALASVTVPDAHSAAQAAARVRGSQAALSALEVDRPDPAGPLVVAALVEGAAASARADRVAGLLGPGATVADAMPDWWGTAPWRAGGTALKISVPLSRVADAMMSLQRHASGLPLALRGSLGTGVLYAGVPGPAPLRELVAALRADLSTMDGTAVVLATPTPHGLDQWGPVRGLTLMRQVKQRFDPHRLLAPGRFVGGI